MSRGHVLPEFPANVSRGAVLIGNAISTVLGIVVLAVAIAIVGALTIDVQVAVTGRGSLHAAATWSVTSQVEGIVDTVLVRDGDVVEAGQILLILDTSQISFDIRELRANILAQQAAIQRVRAQLPIEAGNVAARLRQVMADRTSAVADLRDVMIQYGITGMEEILRGAYRPGGHVALDRAVARVRALDATAKALEIEAQRAHLAEYDLRSERATLLALQARLDRAIHTRAAMTIRAANAGQVVTQEVERLNGAHVSPGQRLLEIVDPTSWRAELLLGEDDIHRVRVGHPAKVTIKALSGDAGHTIPGTVSFVGVTPVEAGGALYQVTIRLGDDESGVLDERLKQGYTMEGSVIVGSDKIATLVWRHFRRSR